MVDLIRELSLQKCIECSQGDVEEAEWCINFEGDSGHCLILKDAIENNIQAIQKWLSSFDMDSKDDCFKAIKKLKEASNEVSH